MISFQGVRDTQEIYSNKHQTCETPFNNYHVCKKSGLRASARKVSLSHICQDFNKDFQSEFVFVIIRRSNYGVLHVVDVGTRYSETSFASRRPAKPKASLPKAIWIHRHGALTFFSADKELIRNTMERFSLVII